jgi:2-polyprenyl-6-methoxyphenol hydroxylase-like FAD-dependent oxidoreductase
MASNNYDIITIGGGLGGATLAKVMAEKGARVLVLESEAEFKDRVRGEVLVAWGVAEAQKLGIYEIMKAAGGRELEWEERKLEWTDAPLEDIKGGRRHLPTTSATGTPKLTFYHPEMQEAILQAASDAGATVHRGVRVAGLGPNDHATVTATVDGSEEQFTARLVVGADGRSSLTRTWGEFQEIKNPAMTWCAGVLFDEMPAPDDTSHNFRNLDQGLTALLFPQGNERVRAYLCYPTAWGMRLSGNKDMQRFIDWSVDAGAPAEYYKEAVPNGPLASFDSTTTWIEHPYRDHVALIGDAAGCTDAIWGQGLSLTMRDVRVLRDKLLEHEDWGKAGNAYAEEHDQYFTASYTVQGWFEQLLVETGSKADARRSQALSSWREDSTRRLDTLSSGPDLAVDEKVRRRFFGED